MRGSNLVVAKALASAQPVRSSLGHPHFLHGFQYIHRPVIDKAIRNHPNGKRSAHTFAFLHDSIIGAQDIILNLHTVTHTPWYVTIPLVALGVNVLFRLPFTIYARRIAQRRVKLTPLLQAWSIRSARSLSNQPIPQVNFETQLSKKNASTAGRLYKQWGVQQWRMYGSFLSLPFWLVAIEAIRRLCGGPRGLLGSLMFGSMKDVPAADAEAAAFASSAPIDVVSAVDVIPADSGTAQDVAQHIVSHIEPSLSTGGCLWFPNLMEADPYHVLPIALSVMLIINLLPRTEAGIRNLFGLVPKSQTSGSNPGLAQTKQTPELNQTRTARGIHRGLLIVASSIGVVTMDLPSALHLYWLSSAAFSYLLTSGVQYIMPIPKWTIRMGKGQEPFFVLPKKE